MPTRTLRRALQQTVLLILLAHRAGTRNRKQCAATASAAALHRRRAVGMRRGRAFADHDGVGNPIGLALELIALSSDAKRGPRFGLRAAAGAATSAGTARL